MTIVISYHTSFKKYIKAAFQIRLSTRQLLRILPKEICIFFNVCRQIIAKVKLS